MIGNDVVDLHLAWCQSNWKRKGFLEKVFQWHEQKEILSSPDPDMMVWLLWSMKEAAYKAHQRHLDLPRRLNWKRQETFVHELTSKQASGSVRIEGEIYTTSSEISKDFIHTSAHLGCSFPALTSLLLKKPSAAVKEQLLQLITTTYSLKKGGLSIAKDSSGKPHIYYQNRPFLSLISLSDHGNFSAFSVALINCEMPVKHY